MKEMLMDKVLENVVGGFGFGMTFEECTRLLQEAGERAWLRSGYWIMGAFIPDSNLHRAIAAAEQASDNETRVAYIDIALAELENPTYIAFPDLFLEDGDKEFIESRLRRVRMESVITPIEW